MRFLPVIFLVSILVLCGCGDEQIPGEDYDDYTDVFAGPGPDIDLEDLYLKLNFENRGTVSGEMEGPFYTKVQGAWIKSIQGISIHLESVFGSLECMGITRVEFTGDINDGELSGVLVYSGCNIYEFFYKGIRVGGTGN